MKWLDPMLKRLGLMPEFTDDEQINASTEDAARTHHSAVEQLHEAVQKRSQGNEALRKIIEMAKEKTPVFVEFDQHLHRKERRHVRRSD